MDDLHDNLEELSFGDRLRRQSGAARMSAEDFGAHIRALREGSGLSRDAMAREIAVSSKYIRALEEGDYAIFGAKVYAHGVLKKMLALTGSPNAADFLQGLDSAWQRHADAARLPVRAGVMPARKNFYLTPARSGVGIAVLVLAIFIFFAAGRLIRFSGPPMLSVDEPEDRATFQEPMAPVRGATERESKLTVNGRELKIDSEGRFGERIELQPGVNRLEFLAENRFGRVTTVVRYVLVE